MKHLLRLSIALTLLVCGQTVGQAEEQTQDTAGESTINLHLKRASSSLLGFLIFLQANSSSLQSCD